jgi:predicted ATPase
VPLAAISDPDLVVSAVAAPLGVRETGAESLEQTLTDYVRDRHLLLVLDNFEHVLPAAPLVGRILAACPNTQMLITSRATLRVYGEREVPVPPLRLPDLAKLLPLAELDKIEAVELFVERAMAIKPGFALTAENARPVAEICVRLEGLPLAIELAAARVRVLPPDRLLDRLAKWLDLLTGGAADRDTRQQTLRGAIAWSYDLLSSGEQQLFRRLSVFVGGCEFDAHERLHLPRGVRVQPDGIRLRARLGDAADHPLLHPTRLQVVARLGALRRREGRITSKG